jgi:hypothetical protein
LFENKGGSPGTWPAKMFTAALESYKMLVVTFTALTLSINVTCAFAFATNIVAITANDFRRFFFIFILIYG